MSWNKPDPETNAPHAHDAEKPDPVKSVPIPAGEKHEDVKDEAARHNDERPRDEESGPIAGRPRRSEEAIRRGAGRDLPGFRPAFLQPHHGCRARLTTSLRVRAEAVRAPRAVVIGDGERFA